MRLFLSLLFSIILFPFFSFAADRVIVIDDGGGGSGASTAAGVTYDPSAVYHSETTVQDALDAISPAAAGTAEASKALVPDSNIDISGLRYIYADRWSFNGDTDTYTSANGDVLTETVGGVVSRTVTESGSAITGTLTGTWDVTTNLKTNLIQPLDSSNELKIYSSTSSLKGATLELYSRGTSGYGSWNLLGPTLIIDADPYTCSLRGVSASQTAVNFQDGGDIEIDGGALSGAGTDGDVKICTNRGNLITSTVQATSLGFSTDTDTYTSATGDVLTETVGGVVSRTVTEFGSAITSAFTGDISNTGDLYVGDDIVIGANDVIIAAADSGGVSIVGGTTGAKGAVLTVYSRGDTSNRGGWKLYGATMAGDYAPMTCSLTGASAYALATGDNLNGGDIEIDGGDLAGAGVDGDVKICTNRGNAIIGGALFKDITTPDLSGNTYTVLSTDYTVLINDDDADVSGTVVVTLPAAASSTGRILNFKKIGSSQTVQLDGNGAETIDGAADADLSAQWESITVQCNGTSWFVI